MAKQKAIKPSVKPVKNNVSASKIISKPGGKMFLGSLMNQLGLIIAIFAFVLYSQSISFNYAVDDSLITNGNNLVKQGASSIPVLLKTDQGYGLNDEGARVLTYRPISLIFHTIEWQLFSNSPHFYHLINVLLYSLMCWLLFVLLCKLFENRTNENVKAASLNLLIPFISILLFVVHPIHTEVVDNIKSQDEIISFLFMILSVLSFISAERKKSVIKLLLGVLLFALALFSKESAIAYIIIIPLILFVFTETKIKKLLMILASLAAVSVVFLIIHLKVLESVIQTRIDILHSAYFNSLVAAPDFITQKATAFYILLRYLFLLIFPYQLSYDYSVAQIPLYHLMNPMVLVSILLYAAMGIYAFLRIWKKDIAAFGILFYLLTLAPVSNLFVRINCTMAERFLFMPSLGFCLLLAMGLTKLKSSEKNIVKPNTVGQLIKTNAMLFTLVFIIAGLFAGRTFARNPDWKDDITLNTHDVKVVTNSSRAHFCYGSEILENLYPKEKNNDKKNKLVNVAIAELTKAIDIYPDLPPIAYARLGTAYGYIGDYKNVIGSYEIAIKKSPFTPPAYFYCDLGLAYSLTSQFEKALSILDSSIKFYPEYKDAYVGKCLAYLQEGKYNETINESNKLLNIDPNNVLGFLYKGCGYLNLKQYSDAIKYLNRGSELDPNNMDFNKNLGIAYQQMGDSLKAKQYFEKANQGRN